LFYGERTLLTEQHTQNIPQHCSASRQGRFASLYNKKVNDHETACLPEVILSDTRHASTKLSIAKVVPMNSEIEYLFCDSSARLKE